MLMLRAMTLIIIGLVSLSLFQATPPHTLATQTTVNPAVSTQNLASSWITLPCKFADIADETPTLDTINAMFGDTYAGSGHYWRTASYDALAFTHTSANWATLPDTVATYSAIVDTATLKAKLFDDCTAIHDTDIDFSQFTGINIVYNASVNAFGTGAPYTATLDGQMRSWSVMWHDGSLYNQQRLLAQRMGEAWGLPHSNNFDNDNRWFDNPWDVMSNIYHTCVDSNVGCIAPYPISYHRLEMGWITASSTYTGDYLSAQLEYLDSAPVNGVSVIIVPIDANRYYTIEARHNTNSAYDTYLPGSAVIIHEVDPNRVEPAWLVGGVDDDNSAGAGAMWIVGETFTDPYNDIPISILAQTANGFTVGIGTAPTQTPTITKTPSLTPSLTITPTLNETETLVFVTDTPTIQPTTNSGVNILKNGAFEAYSELGKAPEEWTLQNPTKDKVKCNTSTKTFAYSGSCAFMFKGTINERVKLKQVIPNDSVSVGDRLRLSAFVKGRNTIKGIRAKLKINYSNGTKDVIAFSSGVQASDYVQFVDELTLTTQVEKVKLLLRYRETSGKVLVDDVAVMRYRD